VRFKLRADLEFLLAEKEVVTKILRLLKMYKLSVLLIKALLLFGLLYQLQVFRKALCDANHLQPQTKTHSMEWHLPDSPQNKFKAIPATGKVMATVFLFLECRRDDFW
jgi:cytochrome oxidase Cu insertion factor (SCO1/SenC/PrrC family)